MDYEAKCHLKQFKIVYDEEDIEFGQIMHQAVCDYIQKSQRSILVLSPNSVNSPNTLYNMHIVEEKLMFTGNDILIIVKLKPLNRMGLDKTLSELMAHRVCLELKDNNQDAQEFSGSGLMMLLKLHVSRKSANVYLLCFFSLNHAAYDIECSRLCYVVGYVVFVRECKCVFACFPQNHAVYNLECSRLGRYSLLCLCHYAQNCLVSAV